MNLASVPPCASTTSTIPTLPVRVSSAIFHRHTLPPSRDENRMHRFLILALAVASLALACAGATPQHLRANARATVHDAGPAPLASTDAGARCGVHIDPPPAPATKPDPTYAALSAYSRDRNESGHGELCAVADDNIANAERAILAGAGMNAPVPKRAWNRATAPASLDLVDRRFRLTSEERAALTRNGFVVFARLAHPSYAWAYHDVYQSQLPIFVSLDSVLHAVYASNDALVATLEDNRLRDIQTQVLDAMACALPEAAQGYPEATAKDVDLYLTVARSLAADTLVASSFGNDAIVKALVEKAQKAEGFEHVAIFGRDRMVDWTAFRPRGHYAHEQRRKTLEPYFRAAMWLSRLELNLATRSCPSSAVDDTQARLETPREDLVALALADLAEKARASQAIAILDDAWALLAGAREDVSLANVLALGAAANIRDLREPDAPLRFRAAIGNRFPRTARLHYVPDGCTGELSAITTLLGPRVVADTTATRALGNPDVAGRDLVHVPDMAYALGHDRAKRYLTNELATYPSLATQLDVARRIVHAPLAGDDLYAHWFDAIRSLATRVGGDIPSFMDGDAYQDLRMNSAVAAFGQIRHNYVLMAGQGYNEGGCEIPDGYVEPAPAVYGALLAYTKRGATAMKEIDPHDTVGGGRYFVELAKVLSVLKRIGDDELAGRPLSQEEKRFLSMVTEMRPATSDSGPTYTGWYFDLFRERRQESLDDAAFIADFYTSVDANKIAYAGATAPRLGIFVVDSGGDPRVVVGPVARAYEHYGPLATRLDDEAATKLTTFADPWAASYTPPAKPEPKLALRAHGVEIGDPGKHDGSKVTLTLRARAPLGQITIELLDHHFAPFASKTFHVGAGTTKLVMPFTIPVSTEYAPLRAVRVRVGEQSVIGQFESYGADERTWGFGGEEPLPYSWAPPATAAPP